jgi:hypothetical protein
MPGNRGDSSKCLRNRLFFHFPTGHCQRRCATAPDRRLGHAGLRNPTCWPPSASATCATFPPGAMVITWAKSDWKVSSI